MKAIVGIVIGILALVGAGAGAVATGILQLPTATPQTNFQAAPPLQPLTAQPTAVPDMTITLSERFLNKRIGSALPTGGQVSNVQLDLQAGETALVSATLRTGFLNVNLRATMKLAAQNGRIVIDIGQVDAGGFGVPSSLIEPQVAELKRTAETELNKQFAEMEKTQGVKLRTLTTTDNSLTLFFTE